MFKQLLKPNMQRFFVKKIDHFMDKLIEHSNMEVERFEEEEI